MTDIFIITSVINTGNRSWSYTPIRSLYTNEERLQQTLDTISSIRTYSPNSLILLVEGSVISDDMQNMLNQLCDYVCYLGNDEDTNKNCIMSDCKGLGDSWLTYKGVNFINDNIKNIKNIDIKNIYKISGRYVLNDRFDVNNISCLLPTFRIVDRICESYVTFIFVVPFSMIDEYINCLLKTIQFMKIHNDVCLEIYLPSLFPNKHIIENIGAEGIIAIDYTRKTYSV